MHPASVIPLAAFAMVVAITVLRPFAKAYAKRIENRNSQIGLPDELASRLERMEQSIDSIAIEVERISEGQRFTTRLLSEGTKTEIARTD